MEISKRKRGLLVTLVSLMVGMIYFIPYIYITFYDQTLEALNLTNTQLGSLGSLYGTLAIFCYMLGSFLAQKFSPRILIAVSLIGTGVAALWESTFPPYAALVVIYVLYAFFTTATLWSAYITLMRSLGTDAEQGRLFGISESIRSVMSTFVGFLFIWIMSLFSSQVGGYRLVLIIAAVIYFLFAALALLLFPKNVAVEKKERTSAKNILTAMKIPGVWLVGLFIFFCYALNCGGAYYFGAYSTQVLHMSDSVASALQIIRTYILAIFLGAIGGFLIDRFKYRTRFLMGLVACAAILSFLMPVFSNFFWVATIASVCISGINYMIKAIYFSVMDEAIIPRELTGAASGIISFIAYIPDAFITLMVGSWLDKYGNGGFTRLFLFMGICGVCAVVCAWLINRQYIASQKERLAS